jgi:hypothetical protein
MRTQLSTHTWIVGPVRDQDLLDRLRVHEDEPLDPDGAHNAHNRAILLHPRALGDARLAVDNLAELPDECAAEWGAGHAAQRGEEARVEVELVCYPPEYVGCIAW